MDKGVWFDAKRIANPLLRGEIANSHQRLVNFSLITFYICPKF